MSELTHQPVYPRKRWSMRGAVAGALVLSFAWAANRLDATIPFPPLSLAERIIRITPGGVATFFIEKLGPNAVRLLSVGTVAGFLVVAAVLPRVSSRKGSPRPYIAGGLLAAILFAAILIDPLRPAAVSSLLVSLAAGGLYAMALSWLAEPARAEASDRSRRRALIGLGAMAAFVTVGGSGLGRFVRRLARPNTDVSIRTPDVPARVPSRPRFPSVPGLSDEVTSPGDHYVVDIDLLDPVVEADGWTLRITGLVDRPMTLTFAELQSVSPLVEEFAVLTCISNPVGGPLVGNSRWSGPRLRDVLHTAQVQEAAVEVVFRCADGYTESLPLDSALDPSVVLAVAQNGQPLRQEHGFPCRLRAPAVYGMKNPKWLEEIEVVGGDVRGYWEQRGWSDDAAVRTESRIDTVGPDLHVGVPTWIAGVAWAGIRGISRVEVSTDGGGTWESAIMHAPLSPYAWTQWANRWSPPAAGPYRILCRATDGTGAPQDPSPRPPHPSGATGYDQAQVDVS